MDKICVVVQGPSDFVHEQKNAWGTTKLVFSTWEGCEDKYSEDDLVIYNSIPENKGIKNYELQRLSTYNGILVAKQMGYDYVLKLRSDLIPTMYEKFLSVLDLDKINFLCWHDNQVHGDFNGYLVDYLMFGKIEDMEKIWSSDYTEYNVPELSMTEKYFKEFDVSNLNFFLNHMNEENELLWIKNGLKLSTYNNHNGYKTDLVQLLK